MKKIKKPFTAREHALAILIQSGIKTPVQQLLNQVLTENILSKQDTALITELVYGYLRSELRISWLLNQFLKNKKKLPHAMCITLGIALYEILYLEKIPPYASIHSSVETVYTMFGKKLAQVANGTLRNILRQCEKTDTPRHVSFYQKRLTLYTQYLSIFYSIPQWIIELWIKSYGKEKTQALAQASISTPFTCIRLNVHQKTWKDLHNDLCNAGGVAVGYSGIYFEAQKQPPLLQDYVNKGAVSFQGSGSQEVLAALDIHNWEQPIWDACAGVGGKTLLLLEQGLSILAASDRSFQKIQKLKSESKRLGLPFTKIFCASAVHTVFNDKIVQKPRTILLDVPCSGLGTLARHPDIRRLRKPEELTILVHLQKKLIATAWDQLPINGHLVYITCTMNPDENEHQILHLLNTYKNATIEKQWESTITNTGSDLMFGAVIRKKILS